MNSNKLLNLFAFTADPVANPDAELYDKLSYAEVLDKELKVMRSEEHTSELQSR